MKNLINKEVQSPKKVKSSKFLKTCFVGCLATCLTLTGIFAFAPLGASAEANSNNQNTNLNSNVNNSTNSTDESTGLITPRADDPVLFTTKSGLEIKWTNVNISPSLESTYAGGFPYFTTNDGSKDYIWLIIGLNNTAVDNTPASKVIANDNKAYLQRLHEHRNWGVNIKHNSEIPVGCALVVSYDFRFATNNNSFFYYNANGKRNGYIHSGYDNTDIQTEMASIYSEGRYGLSSIKSNIVPVNLITEGWGKDTSGQWERFSDTANNSYIFPLAGNSNSSFYALDYLDTVAPISYSSTSRGWAWMRGVIEGRTFTESCATVIYKDGLAITHGYTGGNLSENKYLQCAFCMKL